MHPDIQTNQTKAKQFHDGVSSAAKGLGFDEAELSGISDARVLSALYYADLGRKAEAGAKQLKTKGSPASQGKTTPAIGNNAASTKFNKHPTLDNALNLDF